MKKFAKWVAVNLLWPLLREVLIEALKQLTRYSIDAFKQLLVRWQQEEEAAAKTAEEKQAVREKYSNRRQDLEDLKEDITDRINRIVEEALAKAESERGRLLEEAPEQKKLT